MDWRVVISGAPGTGKTTVAELLAGELGLPLLSLDVVKEALGDVLGSGGEDWSDQAGDAAAEVVFRLARSFPSVVAEGWWRRARRDRAIREFRGWVEVYCHCEPSLAEERVGARAAGGRHPIHRDVINPELLTEVSAVVASATPLRLGSVLVEVDTTDGVDAAALVAAIRRANK